MSEKFSATLRIGDLNDFIAPSQDCIVSLKGKKITAAKPERTEVATSSKSLQIVQTEPVKISLKDCLACSGCITSAETVMLEKQSLDEFLSSINKGKAVIVSISPQSRAAFAVHFGLSPLQVLRKFVTFFKSLGVKAIFDTSCSRDISLIESCNEFIARYRQSHDERCKSSLPMLASACPGLVYKEIIPVVSDSKQPIMKSRWQERFRLELNVLTENVPDALVKLRILIIHGHLELRMLSPDLSVMCHLASAE